MILALVLRRLGLGVGLLVAVSLLLSLGVEALPGDFAQTYLGQAATPQAVANLRTRLGLDEPAAWRYLDWLSGMARGNFSASWASGQPVVAQLLPRLGNTLFFAAVAAAVAVPLSLALGIVAVLTRERLADRLINVVTLAAISLSEFFVGYLLILFFAVNTGWFAFPAKVHAGMGLGERLWTIVLPCATLVLVVLAHMMRMTRAAILNVMSSPYIETAELKGLSPPRVIVRHAAPNAVAPIITVVALNLAYLVVGVVVVEVVFVYPGLGQYMVDAVSVRDVPVVLVVWSQHVMARHANEELRGCLADLPDGFERSFDP